MSSAEEQHDELHRAHQAALDELVHGIRDKMQAEDNTHEPTDYVYRVTRVRPDPSYWQNKKSTKVVSHKAVMAIIRSNNQQPLHAKDQLTFQRALIKEWEDVEL